jgi:hypothetical protein
MHYSKIHVSYGDGSKPKGTKVVLGFTSLLGGMTKPAYTDAYGVALVEHSSTGQADIYVSGTMGRKGRRTSGPGFAST